MRLLPADCANLYQNKFASGRMSMLFFIVLDDSSLLNGKKKIGVGFFFSGRLVKA